MPLPRLYDLDWGEPLLDFLTTEHNDNGTHADVTAESVTVSGDVSCVDIEVSGNITAQGDVTCDELISGSGIKRGGLRGGVFVRADSNSNGTYHPLTPTAWTGRSVNANSAVDIDWYGDCDVPNQAIAVTIMVYAYTTYNGTYTAYLLFGPTGSSSVGESHAVMYANSAAPYAFAQFTLPIGNSGTSQLLLSTETSGLSMIVSLQVVGYYL